MLTLSSTAVVFITSNYIGNTEIMQGCKEADIPAFGTLWDFVRIFYVCLVTQNGHLFNNPPQ
jgi:hypothetical protein